MSSYLPTDQCANTEYMRLTKIMEQLYFEVKTGLDQKRELDTEIEASSMKDSFSAKELSTFQESLKTQRQAINEEVLQLQKLKTTLEFGIRDLTDQLAAAECDRDQNVSEADQEDSYSFEDELQRQCIFEQIQMDKEKHAINLAKLEKQKLNYNEKLLVLKQDLEYILAETKAKTIHIRELTLQADKEEQQLGNMHVSIVAITRNSHNEGGDSLFSEVERNYDELMKKLINMIGYYKLTKKEKAKFAMQLVKLKQGCLILDILKENSEKHFTKFIKGIIRNLKNSRRTSLCSSDNLLHPEKSQDVQKSLKSVTYMEPMMHKIKKEIEECELQMLKEKERQFQLYMKEMQCCRRIFNEETSLLLLRCKNLKIKNSCNTTSCSGLA